MPRPYKILGISGRIGSGKSTLAYNLVKRSPQVWPDKVVRRYSFAEPLKDACINLLGLEHRQVWGTQADKLERTWFGASGRECMEGVGLALTTLNSTWAADLLLRRLHTDMPYLAIVDDVRYLTELKKLQDAGGKIIRLARSTPEQRSSPIEKDLDGFLGFDAVIDNSELSEHETYIRALSHMVRWGWATIEGV